MKKLAFPLLLLPSIPRGVQEYTSGSGTFVVPAGVTSICVLCIGGGAGTDSNVDTLGAQGGSGGSSCYKNNIAVTPGASYSYAVGGGGGAGSSGGTSTFSGTGASLSAGGGVLGSRGGAVSGGDANYFGRVASYTVDVGGSTAYIGAGGSAILVNETRTASVAANGGTAGGAVVINGVTYTFGFYTSTPSGYYGYAGSGASILYSTNGPPYINGGIGGVVRIIWGPGLSYPSNINP